MLLHQSYRLIAFIREATSTNRTSSATKYSTSCQSLTPQRTSQECHTNNNK